MHGWFESKADSDLTAHNAAIEEAAQLAEKMPSVSYPVRYAEKIRALKRNP
jgi:hypothetical protein